MRTSVLLVIIVLLCGTPALLAQEKLTATPHYSRRQLAEKTRSARSLQAFEELARFYAARGSAFREAARREQEEYSYALNHNEGKRYPPASDSARLLKDYYEERAKQSEAMAKHFAERVSSLAISAGEMAPPQNTTIDKELTSLGSR